MNSRTASGVVGLAALFGVAIAYVATAASDSVDAFAPELAVVEAKAPRPLGPRLLAEEPVHDWGVVAEGTEIRWTFKLHNPGTETTRIQKARTSCGCGAFDFTREIPAGGDGHVTVLIPRDRIHVGRLRASITLTTNGKGDDLLVLQGDVAGSR